MKPNGLILAQLLTFLAHSGAESSKRILTRLNAPAIPRLPRSEAKAWPKQYDIAAGGTRQGQRIAKQVARAKAAGKAHPFAASGQS